MTSYGISTDYLPDSVESGIIDSMVKSWGNDQDQITKLATAGVSITMETPGAANAKYGPKIWQLPYINHNALSVLGQKPYETGKRVQTALSIAATTSAGVTRSNWLTEPKIGEYAQLLEPYKVYSLARAMPTGYMQLANDGRDDTVAWEDFIMAEGKTFVQSQDIDALRRVEDAPIVGLGSVQIGGTITSTERVGFESVERIISNAAEAKCLPDTYAIPWYNTNPLMSSSSTNLATYRGQSAVAGSQFDSYVDANYTSGTTSGAATLRPLTMDMIDSLIYNTMPYWGDGDNQTAGKAFVTDYTALQKIGGLVGANQRLLGWEGVNYSVNGVNTVPGRQTGLMASHYNGIPLIPDYNVEKGVAGEAIGAQSGIGRIYMLDQSSIFVGPYIQPQVTTSDNPIMNNGISRMAVLTYQAEIQCQKFRSLGKILHIQ